jgi:multidrug efflux pump subunit AcrA (membrane-fusion protein)
MMNQEADIEPEIELDSRSEEVRDFISHIPHWMIRWGTTSIFVVLSLLVVGTYFIHYPDIVQAPFTLSTTNSPKTILAKTDGRLVRLFVADQQTVNQNQLVAYLESTTRHSEALRLANELDLLFLATQRKQWERVLSFRPLDYQQLGDLQTSFQRFAQNFMQLEAVLGNGSYLKRRKLLQADLKDLAYLYQNLTEQQTIQQQDHALAHKELQVQKKLLEDKVIPPLEYRREESRFLAKQLPLKQTETALVQNHTAQSSKQRELLELDRTIAEQGSVFVQELNTLRSAIEGWKQRFVVMSPTAGKIYFNSDLQEQQTVAVNQELFMIGSADRAIYRGLLNLPQANLGKIKVGQEVLIKFAGYPFQEYGSVRGRIQNVADVPDRNGTFLAKISLPAGLRTQYGKTIQYRSGMTATAEVITEDTRLIEKVFYAIRKVLAR